jgi:secreted Zn-dependent insulinase-like peptidase
MPSLYKTWLSRSADYVGNLLGHEGAGSLLSELKRRMWANELSAGVSSDGYNTNTCTYNFDIDVTLTDTGLVHHQQVIELVFSYLALLRTLGPQEGFYQEEAATRAMEFR